MKHKHRPCPCGCGDMADECMAPHAWRNPLGAFQITEPDPRCVCCQKSWPKPDARTDRGPIHFRCWDEHHSDPHESHNCKADD